MRILVTGAAGFIGAALSRRLLERGDEVLGVDNLNSYYHVSLKRARLELLVSSKKFSFVELDVADRNGVTEFFKKSSFTHVVHLAAQAGVRYSITNPYAYGDSNLLGFLNILEGCRHHKIRHLVYASSSSVYGANRKMPFSEHDNVDHPVSLYAATKKANELMAHSYSAMYGLPTTGLRFFTVYGPWGRPDMSLFLFTKNALEGKPIDVFNHGHHRRDFTYIDDIVSGLLKVVDQAVEGNKAWDGLAPDPASSFAPYRVYNIGNSAPVQMTEVIDALEETLGRKIEKNLLPMQPGDLPDTFADVKSLEEDFHFKPQMPIRQGIKNFVGWYREFYRV